MINEFKVGDSVSAYGINAEVLCVDNDEFTSFPYYIALDDGRSCWTDASSLRPRNFLSKIEEEQRAMYGHKTVDQQFNEVFKPERFQRNAYGQLVDTVTGMEADSDGLVKISSIRDSVREIS